MNIHLSNTISRMFCLSLCIALMMGCNAKGLMNLQSGNLLGSQEWLGEPLSFTVPFDWHDGHIIIELEVNNQQNLRFALDSGASATVLFETQRTKALKLSVGMQLDLQGSDVNIVNDASIAIGKIKLSEMTIIQVPIEQSPLFGSFDEAYFDGAIGYDLLNRYVTLINYADKTVTFFKDSPAIIQDGDWVKLPMSVIGRIPHVAASLYNKGEVETTYNFTIDTGAPDYLYINSSLAANLSFPSSYFETKTRNFTGEHIVQTSRFDVFKIAEFNFNNIAIHNLPYFKDENGIGLIGSGLLRNFDIVFDYENEYIAFKKNRLFSYDTFIDRSGLRIEPHTGGALVKEVVKDTHAQTLNILAGDVVTKINNKTLNDNNFDELRALLSSDMNEVELCWVSNEQEKCEVLFLRDMI